MLQALRAPVETLDGGTTLGDTLAKLQASTLSTWPVLSREGVIGVLARETIESAAKDGGPDKKLQEIVPRENFPHVHSDHSLHAALDRMGAAKVNLLPVVSRANVHEMLGIVTLGDVLALYRVQKREPSLPPLAQASRQVRTGPCSCRNSCGVNRAPQKAGGIRNGCAIDTEKSVMR